MRELISQATSDKCRRYLLATVSTLAIIGLGTAESEAQESAEGKPTVWIELGGQLNHLGKDGDAFVPAFAEFGVQNGLISPASVQKPSNYSFGEQGSIRIQPAGSEWSGSVSVRYGRSNTKKRAHEQVPVTIHVSGYPTAFQPYGPGFRSPIPRSADYTDKSNESHVIVDFEVGKDVGLGMISPAGVFRIDVGVRFAQFTSRSNMTLLADPDPHLGFKYIPPLQKSLPILDYFQLYRGYPEINRGFTGLGPSLAWSGSMPLARSNDSGASLALEVKANFSVLFGRQKAGIHHNTTGDRVKANALKYRGGIHSAYSNQMNTVRSRSVVVPNIGGQAGISLNLPNAQVSLGYRADFFLRAMDGGINTYKGFDRNFYGPFATISIGLP